nr:hypothetical protein [Tanacetum cinerariifolium]
MIAILEKYEHNQDFHQIVDFVEASHIRYALTINPTVYVSHIRQFWSTARVETSDAETKILATVDSKPRIISESSIRRNLKLNDEARISSLPDAELFENLTLMGQYTKRARIAQSLALPTDADEPASPLGDDSQGVISLAVDEGNMQQQINELIDLCTRLQRQQIEMASKIAAQNLEISQLKARVKFLEDKDRGVAAQSGDDAPIKGRSLESGEEIGAERSTKRGSDDIEELVNVFTSLDAAKILTSRGVQVSIPPAVNVATATVSVPIGSGVVPTASPIFTTATVATHYSRRKGKEKMVESETPKKKKLQEQMDVQMARQLDEEMARDAQRMNEQIARDAEIVRIHAKEELQILIDGLDRSNEVIARHLQGYEKAVADLSIGEKIDLINMLVKYQDHHTKILKYQAQQSKPLTKKQQRKFYTSVLRNHVGWKVKHFKGMSLKEIKEKFDPVWKQIQDFIPIGSKEEGERFKRKRIRLEQDSAKKVKTSEEVPKENLKEMMRLIPMEEVYVEALQVKHLIIDWEIHSKEGKRDSWRIIRLERNTAVYHFFVDMLKNLEREDLNKLWTLVKETLSIR